MTTTTPTSAEELRERLAGHKQEITDAGRLIASAELDGSSATAASKRLSTAREGARRAALALSELERREEEAAAHHREIAAVTERLLCNQWFAAYLHQAEEVIRLRDLAAEAEKRLASLPARRKINRAQDGMDGLLSTERDIARDLVSATRDGHVLSMGQPQCRMLHDRALALAAEDERQLAGLRRGGPEEKAA